MSESKSRIDQLSSIKASNIEQIDEHSVNITLDNSDFFDFYVEFNLDVDFVVSTNGVGGETCDYTASIKIEYIEDELFGTVVSPALIPDFSKFENTIKEFAVNKFFENLNK